MPEFHFLNRYALREELKDAARKVIGAFRQEVSNESLYAFAFYTSGEATYVVPSLNTEEGLSRKSATYIESGNWGDGVSRMRQELRWNPCDWDFHGWKEDEFETVSKRLGDYWWIVTSTPEGVERYGKYEGGQPEEVYLACLEALSELDAEGLFGEGEDRERITIGLWMGDQSDEERLRWARMVNPPAVWKRLEYEMKP